MSLLCKMLCKIRETCRLVPSLKEKSNMSVGEILENLKFQFATLQEKLQESESRIQNMESVESSTQDTALIVVDSEQYQTVSDESTYITIATQKFSYPTPSQQIERAVWRNIEFEKYLISIGLSGRPVTTSLVTNWFKRFWFGDERLGPKRLFDAGFTEYDMLFLTTHHIVPNDLGGADSVYNYHLVLRNINSHFGELFTRESIAWVGVEHAHVAKSFCKFAKKITHDDLNGQKFDPFQLTCPKTAIKKRRIVVHDTETQSKEVCVGAVENAESLQYTSINDVKPIPFKWRLDWFPSDHFIRFCVETKYVDTGDVFLVTCASKTAAKSANSAYLGQQKLYTTAEMNGFSPDVLRYVRWSRTRSTRKILPVDSMKNIVSNMTTTGAKMLLPEFSKFVDDMSKCRLEAGPSSASE